MKRLFALLLVVCMLCSGAFAAEILFRDIPWGSSTNYIEKSVRDFAGGYDSTLDDMPMPYWPEDPFDIFSANTPYAAGWQVYTYTDQLKVAGYPVISVDAYCHYGVKDGYLSKDKNDGQFYQAIYTFDVINIADAYTDLKGKLDHLYGPGTESIENGSGAMYGNSGKTEYDQTTKFTVWFGDDDTAAMLCCSTSSLGIEQDMWHNNLTLRYGKTDCRLALESVASTIKNEQMIAEVAGAVLNFDGL